MTGQRQSASALFQVAGVDRDTAISRLRTRAIFGLVALLCLAGLVAQNSVAASGRLVVDTDNGWLNRAMSRSRYRAADDVFWAGRGQTVTVDYAATATFTGRRRAHIAIKPWESVDALEVVEVRENDAGRLTATIAESGFYQVSISADLGYRARWTAPPRLTGRIEAHWTIR